MHDCFMFHTELDLVEIRLNVLNEVVEKFVIVEADHTHTGMPRELLFENNKHRFEKFLHKIIYLPFLKVAPQEMTLAQAVWFYENGQRNMALEALNVSQPSDGVLFISDADEIPKPEKLLEARDLVVQTGWPVALDLYNCMYYMNYTTSVKQIKGPFAYMPSNAENVCSNFWNEEKKHPPHDPSTFRWHIAEPWCADRFKHIPYAGWHFSAMGGYEVFKKKLESCAHIEFNNDEFKSEEYFNKCIKDGVAYFEEKYSFGQEPAKYFQAPLTFLPKYVQDNLDRFDKYILR